MGARLLYHIKEVYPDDAVLEVVIWKLPKATKDRPHGLKYRFYYGSADGSVEIRYDNETGKGDHCHYGNREEPYVFSISTPWSPISWPMLRRREAKDEQTTRSTSRS